MWDTFGPFHQSEELLICGLTDVCDGVVGLVKETRTETGVNPNICTCHLWPLGDETAPIHIYHQCIRGSECVMSFHICFSKLSKNTRC